MYFINHSGGAEGSDYYWNKAGEAYNTESINYSFEGHKPKTDNNKILTDEELSEADSHLITANFKGLLSTLRLLLKKIIQFI